MKYNQVPKLYPNTVRHKYTCGHIKSGGKGGKGRVSLEISCHTPCNIAQDEILTGNIKILNKQQNLSNTKHELALR
jgi:hypothetical protein